MNPTCGISSIALLLGAAALAGCGHDDVWDTAPAGYVPHGLDGAAAIVDPSGERALLLPVEHDLTVSPISLPINRGYAASATTPDGRRLLVLTRGDVPRLTASDQGPRLTVIGGGTSPEILGTYDLGDPLSGLAIDPQDRYAVLYPSDSDSSFLENPNELSIVDLSKPAGAKNPSPMTLRSFGGRPQSFVFTPDLLLPGGRRRLLVALTDRDVGIIDLSDPAAGDITVRLSTSSEHLTPAGVAVTDGDAARDDDARLAIRLADDPNVVLVDLLPVTADQADKSAHQFRPTPNIVFAGGVPSDVAFVNTDGGLRLAALVPSLSQLTLVDPANGISTAVDLGAPFEHISIVTSVVGGTASGADVALLWSTSSAEIAFVSLGATVGKPYKSVDKLELEQPVAQVFDVPAPSQRLKILAGADGTSFFVLDLVERTSAPILSNGSTTALTLSPDGQRAWVLAPGLPVIAALDLHDLHPQNLALRAPAMAAFDVARRDGGRALVAIEPSPAADLTVLDGEHPSLTTAVAYSSVLLGSLR